MPTPDQMREALERIRQIASDRAGKIVAYTDADRDFKEIVGECDKVLGVNQGE